MKTTDVVLWKRKRTDSEGTISLRVSTGSQRSYLSLGYKLNEKHWDEASQRVKRTDSIDYKAINQAITTKLAELAELEILKDVAPVNTSFTSYCETFIKGIENHGSKTKYTTVVNKFNAFIKQEKHKESINFDELTPDLIRELHNYLNRKIERNTANHYMKIYSQIINRAIKERKHTYLVHPFITTDYKRTVKPREILTVRELKQFNQVIVPERLKRAQKAFVFQLLAQGMRVSDLIRLRWSSIKKDGYIEYTMFKTGKPMTVFVNNKMYDILIEIAEDIPPFKQHPGLLKLRQTLNDSYIKAKNELLKRGIMAGDKVLNNEHFPNNEYIKDYILNKDILYINLKEAIKGLRNTKYANDFIFSFLKESIFPQDVNGYTITEQQYKQMHSAKIVYNRQLKVIQKLAGIDTLITSHLARHAYTQLMLTDKSDYDVYDISKALGHSTLKTTESYIGTFSKDHTGKINEAISNRLDL
jgi:integrase